VLTTVVVLLVVVALPVAVLAGRWAWACRRRRLQVWWAETLQPVLHPPRTLDVAALQRRIFLLALRQVSVSGRGVAVLPAAFVVEVSEEDLERLGPLHHIVEDELADALGVEATKEQWLRPERVRVTIRTGDVVEGRPRVRVVLGPQAVDAAGPSGGSGGTGPAGHEGRADRAGRHDPAPHRVQPGRTTIDPDVHDRTGPGRTGPDGTAAHRTAPRRTAIEVPSPAPAAATAGAQRLVVCELIAADGGVGIDLTGRTGRLTVGRAGTDVVLDDGRVSSHHAELVPAQGGQWLLDDAASLNGTWVNGRRVERANLVHGDEISFASEGPRFLFSRLADADR
jgi:hypothetical protein